MEVASVRLFNVVLLPEEGLPTRPMRGSRGISGAVEWLKSFHVGCDGSARLEFLSIRKCGVLGPLVVWCGPTFRLRSRLSHQSGKAWEEDINPVLRVSGLEMEALLYRVTSGDFPRITHPNQVSE